MFTKSDLSLINVALRARLAYMKESKLYSEEAVRDLELLLKKSDKMLDEAFNPGTACNVASVGICSLIENANNEVTFLVASATGYLMEATYNLYTDRVQEAADAICKADDDIQKAGALQAAKMRAKLLPEVKNETEQLIPLAKS